MSRPGRMKNGMSARDSSVITQDRYTIVISTNTRVSPAENTVDRSWVTACWAPTTSVFSLLTSAPVCALVKNARGWRCTWSKILVRRS